MILRRYLPYYTFKLRIRINTRATLYYFYRIKFTVLKVFEKITEQI